MGSIKINGLSCRDRANKVQLKGRQNKTPSFQENAAYDLKEEIKSWVARRQALIRDRSMRSVKGLERKCRAPSVKTK